MSMFEAYCEARGLLPVGHTEKAARVREAILRHTCDALVRAIDRPLVEYAITELRRLEKNRIGNYHKTHAAAMAVPLQ